MENDHFYDQSPQRNVDFRSGKAVVENKLIGRNVKQSKFYLFSKTRIVSFSELKHQHHKDKRFNLFGTNS